MYLKKDCHTRDPPQTESKCMEKYISWKWKKAWIAILILEKREIKYRTLPVYNKE